MNQEDILKMAREAGFKANSFSPVIARHSNGSFVDMQSEVERFAALVAAKAAQDEREACASLDLTRCNITFSDAPFEVLQKYRGAIRARGQ